VYEAACQKYSKLGGKKRLRMEMRQFGAKSKTAEPAAGLDFSKRNKMTRFAYCSYN
jgi:hypothetical protein